MVDNLRIGIIGNIGVGKSTLVDAMENEYSELLLNALPFRRGDEKVLTFPEEFQEEVLEVFYEDPVAHAFMAQIEFFRARIDRQDKIDNTRGLIIEDRVIFEDRHIFGEAQRINNSMTLPEFATYDGLYNILTKRVDEPNLIVYLKANVDTLIDRIKKRGRESEKSLPKNYLETLNCLYEKFVNDIATAPVLTIETDGKYELNGYLKETVEKVAKKINELKLSIATPGLADWLTIDPVKATIKAMQVERKLRQYLAKNSKLITVAGNVGLGKSTFTKIAQESLQINGLYENPMENPLLQTYIQAKTFEEKKAVCYHLQLHFLQMRTEQRIRGKTGNQSYIKDRSFAEDVLVFDELLRKKEELTSENLTDLKKRYLSQNKRLPQADLMILLTGSSELAYQRIEQRGRPGEVEHWGPDLPFMTKLYNQFAAKVQESNYHNNPILCFNTRSVDTLNPIHRGFIYEQMYQALTKEDH